MRQTDWRVGDDYISVWTCRVASRLVGLGVGRILMPAFQSPLQSDESRLPKRKLHESDQNENANSKRHASGAAFPHGPAGDTQYWMVQWYVAFRVFLATIEWAVIKESSSGKETQDMGGGWRPCCD